MKVWKGNEMEGADKGILTLFVKNVTVRGRQIVHFLEQHTACKRVYLGAGRTDVIDSDELSVLMNYCKYRNIPVVLECSLEGLKNVEQAIIDSVDQIIVRCMSSALGNLSMSDVLKIDTTNHVYTIQLREMIHTDLVTLESDIFTEEDVIIYNEEGN